MGKNIRSLQLLRNTALFNDKAAAIAGIQSGATNDGTVKLARYKEKVASGETKVEVIKTIFGICYNPTDNAEATTGYSYTIYDSPQEVITALEGRIKANEDAIGVLNGVDKVEGSVAKKIKDAIAGLDATIASTGGTFVNVQVVETDGKITAVNVTENDIASAALLGNSGDTSGSTTAFGYIAKEAADRAAAITAAINDLDVEAVGGTGKVITTISETNGKISATAIDLTAKNVAATAFEAADDKVAVTGATVEAQIESLAKSVKATSADAKSYSISAVSGKELTDLGTNVKEAYKLVDEDGVKAGEIIKIYKDSSLKSVALNGQTLNFTYILANGSESTVGVDVSTFLAESEFSNGLAVVDHVVSVKVDTASEKFLTVGADGVKLSGVQAAINKAATEVVEDAAGHVTVTKTTGTNNQAIYTIGENDIASASDLTAEVNRAKAAEDKIEASVGLAADGSYAANTAATYISRATSLNDADIKLDEAIKSVADTAARAHTEVKAKADGHVRVAVAKSKDGTHDVVTVTETDIASASGTNNAITAETSAREAEDAKIVAGVGFATGNTYTIAANAGAGKSLSAASGYTVANALYTLDDAIAAAKKANTLVKEDETVVVGKNAQGNTTVKVNIAEVVNDGNKIVTFDGKKFIYSEAILDAGTY